MYINIDNVDEAYSKLKSMIVDRKEQVGSFISFLENRTTWLTSPASTKFHLCCHKGLLIHSVGVACNLLEIKEAIMPQLDDESAVICALFHDTGKLGMPDKPLYLKGSTGYYYNPDTVSMGLGLRSLYLVSKYIDLTDDEAQAIAYHDGQYIDENHIVAHRERPLTVLLHFADYWTAHIYEDDKMRKDFVKQNFNSIIRSAGSEHPAQVTPEAMSLHSNASAPKYFRKI